MVMVRVRVIVTVNIRDYYKVQYARRGRAAQLKKHDACCVKLMVYGKTTLIPCRYTTLNLAGVVGCISGGVM